SSCALPDLPAYVLAVVADSLALVRLWRTDAPDLGGDLPNLLLVGAPDDDLRWRWHLERDARRRVLRHGMREADAELERRPAQRGAIADALDLETLLEAFCDALDHVRDQRSGQPVERAVGTAVARPRDGDRAVVLLDLHPLRNRLCQLALRPVDRHAPR